MVTVKKMTDLIRDKEKQTYTIMSVNNTVVDMTYNELMASYRDLYVVNMEATFMKHSKKLVYIIHY